MPFGVGAGELLLILIVALIVFGPGRLPEIAGSMGRALRDFRRAVTDMSVDLTREPTPPPTAPTPGEQRTCPQCNTTNPKAFNFCRQCGAALTDESAS